METAPSTTNWADVFGMVIAVTAIIITVISVFVAFLLSRNYLQSVREMEALRSASERLEEQVKALSNVNTSLLRESMLAVRAIFDLLMLTEQRRYYEGLREALTGRSEWKGAPVSEVRATEYLTRLDRELSRVNIEIVARQTELYWLVGQKTERSAHLHALASTKGDARTIALLEAIRNVRWDADERDELLVAVTALRQRLGKHRWTRPKIVVDSNSWTGLDR